MQLADPLQLVKSNREHSSFLGGWASVLSLVLLLFLVEPSVQVKDCYLQLFTSSRDCMLQPSPTRRPLAQPPHSHDACDARDFVSVESSSQCSPATAICQPSHLCRASFALQSTSHTSMIRCRHGQRNNPLLLALFHLQRHALPACFLRRSR